MGGIGALSTLRATLTAFTSARATGEATGLQLHLHEHDIWYPLVDG